MGKVRYVIKTKKESKMKKILAVMLGLGMILSLSAVGIAAWSDDIVNVGDKVQTTVSSVSDAVDAVTTDVAETDFDGSDFITTDIEATEFVPSADDIEEIADDVAADSEEITDVEPEVVVE